MQAGILNDIRVLDFSHQRAGPHCTMMLGDMGADVLKVERLGGEVTRHNGPTYKGESIDFLSTNRNKRSIICDFGNEADRQLLRELIGSADVVVQNFRPGAMQRAGFGAEQLTTQDPRLIYCSITGYGARGELADEPSYDQVVQAYSGLMSVTGTKTSGPLRVGLPIADLMTGVFAAMGIVAAVTERERSGRGQHVEISLLESVVSMLSFQAMRYLILGEIPTPAGNDHPILAPTGIFKAADGYLSIASSNDGVYERLCTALARPDLATSPKFKDNTARVRNRSELNAEIERTLGQDGVKVWTTRLRKHKVPCGPVNNVGQALDDPQVRANDMVLSIHHPTLGEIPNLGFPIKFSRTPMSIRRHPPAAGEHDASVRRGDRWEEIVRERNLHGAVAQ
jgi:crotonobetainyl-CoA:carnitine CoA-transferase CaiB-like acyl-CoA transferase